MTSAAYQPTASQWASAACHFDRMADWRFVRIAGERYAVIPSGTSGRTYLCRAAADGCSCPWYVRTGRQCAHMLTLELAELELELREAAPDPSSHLTYDALMPACRDCGDLADGLDGRCDRCASEREWNARRELVGAAR
jgi:hypothetical protein